MPRRPRTDPVDEHVGARLRQRRSELGISQEKLAAAADISFQQIQKYEKGRNRISASKLYHFAEFLKVQPGWFFQGLNDKAESLPETDPPPASWIRLWYMMKDLPEDVRQDYMALGRACSRNFP